MVRLEIMRKIGKVIGATMRKIVRIIEVGIAAIVKITEVLGTYAITWAKEEAEETLAVALSEVDGLAAEAADLKVEVAAGPMVVVAIEVVEATGAAEIAIEGEAEDSLQLQKNGPLISPFFYFSERGLQRNGLTLMRKGIIMSWCQPSA